MKLTMIQQTIHNSLGFFLFSSLFLNRKMKKKTRKHIKRLMHLRQYSKCFNKYITYKVHRIYSIGWAFAHFIDRKSIEHYFKLNTFE